MPTTASSSSWRAALTVGLAALCALPAYGDTQAPVDDPRAAVAKMLPECEPRYAEIDARIARAGVTDASYYRIKGFPYLRTDRLMSSFNGELDNDEALEAWLLQLRDNDQFSRDIELRNLGMETAERTALLLDLRLCAVWLSFLESTDPQRRKAMVEAAQVPEQPAVSPAPQRTPESTSAGDMRLWRTAIDGETAERLLAHYEKLPQDPLRRKGMTSDGWQALAAHFAPTWSVAGAGPRALRWQDDGLTLDREQAAVYHLPSFARAGEQLLVQFSYFLWFASADGESIDGLIWRVTLDPDGRPLIYDSLRADGGDHRFYLAQSLEPLRGGDLAQVDAGQITGVGPVTVRLDAGTHEVIEVVSAPAPSPSVEARSYALLPYEALLTLPRADGSTLSAFDADGRLRQPGSAIRQWGRHATLSSLNAAFDDPHLIESRFRLPEAMSPERYALLLSLLQASNP
jgi:hypothetical protein